MVLHEIGTILAFIVPVRGRDFVTVPYTFHMNDIVSFPFAGWNPAAYEQVLRDEFDQLYEEGAHRRRMMVTSLHDRISGHPPKSVWRSWIIPPGTRWKFGTSWVDVSVACYS